jgi:hypothetical protein
MVSRTSGISASRLTASDEFFFTPSELLSPSRAFARYVRDVQLLAAMDLPAERANALGLARYAQYVEERDGV